MMTLAYPPPEWGVDNRTHLCARLPSKIGREGTLIKGRLQADDIMVICVAK
jgi:hypothetical protein